MYSDSTKMMADLCRYVTVRWWKNPQDKSDRKSEKESNAFINERVEQAKMRLERFRPYFLAVNPDTGLTGGLVESKLIPIDAFAMAINKQMGLKYLQNGQLLLKGDHELPISGSIKARGGIHEVLAIAEAIAKEANIIDSDRDYAQFSDDKFKQLFQNYHIIVGSTGNLGLSIGLMGSQLGLQVSVHMSRDAKPWKIEKLRAAGVHVVLHEGDYGKAVEAARNIAMASKNTYFVDDERSDQLFAGYAVGGLRLKGQLEEMGIEISEEKQLYVYLPCGVGGGPGGVAYGLKQVFGNWVHPIFIEPTHAPCFLLAMVLGSGKPVPIADFGLDNVTAADGLAVGNASELALVHAGPLLEGIVTAEDQTQIGRAHV